MKAAPSQNEPLRPVLYFVDRRWHKLLDKKVEKAMQLLTGRACVNKQDEEALALLGFAMIDVASIPAKKIIKFRE